jgi:hypothetical protein
MLDADYFILGTSSEMLGSKIKDKKPHQEIFLSIF